MYLLTKKMLDGIVTVTMDHDRSGQRDESAEYRDAMSETVAKLEAEEGLTGVVFASAKKVFFAGGDLNELLAVKKGEEAQFMAMLEGTVKRRFPSTGKTAGTCRCGN